MKPSLRAERFERAGRSSDPATLERALARALRHAVLLAAGLVLAGVLINQLLTLLVALLVTVIIAIPASALATRLERFHVPRAVGALLALLLGIGVFATVFALMVPPLVDQGRVFVDRLPEIVDSAIRQAAELTGMRPARIGNDLQSFVGSFADHPQRLLGPLASIGVDVATAIAGLVFVLVTAYYLAVRPAPVRDAALRLFPPEHRARAAAVADRLRSSWIGWLQGVSIDMVVSGVLLYVGLLILNVDFAFLFAALSAVLVVVPYFGAVIGGIPPVVFGLTESPGKALLVLGVYLLVQQIEGHLTVPLVMAQRVRLHPAAVAVGVVAVAELFGLIGMFVGVPIISTAVVLVDELWVKRHEAGTELGTVTAAARPGEPSG